MKTLMFAAALCMSGAALAGPAKNTAATAAATQDAHTATYSSPNVSGMDAAGAPIVPAANAGNTGTGGPFIAAGDGSDDASGYPLCTRTIRDSCMQMARSPRPRR